MKKAFALFLSIALLVAGRAQQAVTSADIYLGLKKLGVLGSVLYVAAHPDDENTRLLTWLSKDRLYRTGYLSLTRGDGGQNLIGNEQGIALGLIRTQELLAARRIDGAEQFFTRAFDFGFSKNPEETFTKWDREKILADVVWTIRKFRPDVLITRFPTTGEGGHGHHTASAILANEAFKVAGDPKRFPEQLKWVEPWQPLRILWNTFNFGGNNTQRDDQFKVDVGGFNPVLGRSYGEIAADSRSQHKSQGFGVPQSRGEALEFFTTTGGTAPSTDLMDGVDASWRRTRGAAAVQAQIEAAVRNFDFVAPQKTVPQLIKINEALSSLDASYWRDQKMKEVQLLLAQCSGLWMDATTAVQNAVQGDSVLITVTLNNRSGADAYVHALKISGADTVLRSTLAPNKNLVVQQLIPVPATKSITHPYWLREQMDRGMFSVSDQDMIGLPEGPPPFQVQATVRIAQRSFTYLLPVRYKHTDPVKGEIYQPLFVVPPVTLASTPDLLIFRKDAPAKKALSVRLHANSRIAPAQAEISLRSEKGALVKKDEPISLERGFSKDYLFELNNEGRRETENVSAVAHLRGPRPLDATVAMTGISYDHIPTIRYFFNDGVKLLNLDLKTAGRRIGYIVGAGDKVPEALEEMGYEVTLLDEKAVQRNNLQQYDAIITAVRAYNTAEWLNEQYERLMQYVQEGGNLIVQYNTSSQIGPVRAKIAPFTFDISRTRVTDEGAAVHFLKPEHPALNFPNKITSDDFKNWVQERSIYHAANLAPQFEKILGMADPGEKSDDASLVVAKYGKGYFTYTGLVFFRQLPAGVPGAYRLLANLIALNNKKAF